MLMNSWTYGTEEAREFEASPAVSLALAAKISVQNAEMYIKNVDGCHVINRTVRLSLPADPLTPGEFVSRYFWGTFLVFSQQKKVFVFRDGELLNDEAPDCWDRVEKGWQIFI